MFTILHAGIKGAIIHKKYERELKKSKVKVYTKKEREEYIKNNLEKKLDEYTK